MTIMKLHKIHSMAMGYKTAFESANDIGAKTRTPWAKGKLANANAKMTNMATHFGKNNNAVSNKHLKHNVPSKKPLSSSMSATVECMSKKKRSDKSNEMKPLVLRSTEKGGTGHESLVLNVKPIMRSKKLKTHLQDKSDITITIMMKNNALASSSSPCPSFPETTIPKNISHGH
jgi:hypothetical protein